MTVQVRNENVGGIPLAIYHSGALSSLAASKPIAVLFLLHGRFGKASSTQIIDFANALVAGPGGGASGGSSEKELVVVAFDQRNHGERLTDQERNKGWRDYPIGEDEDVNELDLDNKTHLVDMYSIQFGTAKDVSFLIDFLPAFLFPESESTITDWFVAGISLGGHATWLALANEPRLTLGIPIIGSPSYHRLLSHRYSTLHPSLAKRLPSQLFPPTLLSLVSKLDAVNTLDNGSWKGRKVLVLSGAVDPLVPYVEGGSEDFVKDLEKSVGKEGKVEVYVEPEVGHALTPEMVKRSTDFVWSIGLGVGRSSGHL